MRRYVNLYFITCTLLNWNPLLKEDDFKEIIIDSFRFLVGNKKVTIWAFVIMDNHIHVIWQIIEPNTLQKVQSSLLKYTAQQFKFKLNDENRPNILNQFLVHKRDREYQFWKRNSLSIEIYSDRVLMQKANYIHMNPERKGLPEDYLYSSKSFYETGMKNWDFLFQWE